MPQENCNNNGGEGIKWEVEEDKMTMAKERKIDDDEKHEKEG